MADTGKSQVQDCTRELWQIFEKTGSIAAFILYTDMKKKSGKKEEDSGEKATK